MMHAIYPLLACFHHQHRKAGFLRQNRQFLSDTNLFCVNNQEVTVQTLFYAGEEVGISV